jgi:RNA polymerase sigma factor (sigma-70 family)
MKSEAVVRQFQRLLEPGTIAGLSERQVLERFAERGDPVASEAIVARHGPLVFMVCRHLLRDPNDVEDAFQATFLICIKKAATLRQTERLGPWLYGVAYRVAIRARTRRRTKELPEGLADPQLASSVEDDEQLDVLHDEIQRLPENYRAPIVLCCIEGLSHDEAARQLGWPVGTVHGRLSRARELLRGRLTRRGILPSDGVTGALALLFPRPMILPAAMRQAAAALLDGTVSGSLETLTNGVQFAMLTENLKQMGMAVVMCVIALGTVTMAVLAYEGPPAKSGVLGSDYTEQDGERNKPQEAKAVPEAKTSPDDQTQRENQVRLRAEAELERSHQELDELLAKASLIQIELDVTRKAIESTVESLENPESRFVAQNIRRTARDPDDLRTSVEHDRKRLQNQLEGYRSSYSQKWIHLASLKRQIVRQARPLGVTPEIAPTGTELTHRLDQLEKKIDRIIDSLPAK